MTVEWARPDLKPKYVFLRRGGTELQRDKHPMYKGRTSLSEDKLRWGDISLKLTEVKLSDSGAYRCLVLATKTEYVIKLTAGSVSLPTVSISKASSGMVLQCKSEGWYPEPEVLWLDGEGNLLSAGSTEIIRGPNDLYTVSSRVTVERRHNNMFTCRVTQNNITQTRETQIHVSDELFMVQSSSIVRITICVIVCFVSIVAVVLVVRKCGQNKKSKKHHEGETDLGERKMFRHEHQLLLEFLDNVKAKQDEKLEMKEEELEHVQQVITALTEQKNDLKIQRTQIISLQQEDMVQIKKNQMKLDDTSASFSDTKKELQKTKEDLEKRKTIHDELLKNTEKQLESTDVLFNTMTERKGKLENDKEQIKKYLKETERKREEVQEQIQREEIQRKRVEEEKMTK